MDPNQHCSTSSLRSWTNDSSKYGYGCTHCQEWWLCQLMWLAAARSVFPRLPSLIHSCKNIMRAYVHFLFHRKFDPGFFLIFSTPSLFFRLGLNYKHHNWRIACACKYLGVQQTRKKSSISKWQKKKNWAEWKRHHSISSAYTLIGLCQVQA